MLNTIKKWFKKKLHPDLENKPERNSYEIVNQLDVPLFLPKFPMGKYSINPKNRKFVDELQRTYYPDKKLSDKPHPAKLTTNQWKKMLAERKPIQWKQILAGKTLRQTLISNLHYGLIEKEIIDSMIALYLLYNKKHKIKSLPIRIVKKRLLTTIRQIRYSNW